MDELAETKELVSSGALTISARMYWDHDAKPNDAECYTDADIAAWYRREWNYVGVVVAVSLGGIELSRQSVWGTEHGTLTGRKIDALDFSEAGGPLSIALKALAEAESWAEQFCGTDSAAESLLTDARRTLDASATA